MFGNTAFQAGVTVGAKALTFSVFRDSKRWMDGVQYLKMQSKMEQEDSVSHWKDAGLLHEARSLCKVLSKT